MNAGAALLIVLAVGSCAAGDQRCATAPVGHVNAFFGGARPSGDLVATVAKITAVERLGFHYDMTDGTRLTWIAREAIPTVNAGGSYRFVVDYAPGSPGASALLVYENDLLLFAAITDSSPFEHVLKRGLPGFTIATGESECRSRANTKCHDSIVNLPLLFDRAGERATLYQGETARMSDFEVRVLTSHKVSDSSRCADAGLPGVSFTIARVK